MIYRLLAIALLLVAQVAGAADYYACDCQADADPDCVVGDDARGTPTAALPWLTIGALRDQADTATGGDNFYLCDGGAFDNDDGFWEGDCDDGVACEITGYVPTWATSDEDWPHIHSPTSPGIRFDNDGTNDIRGNWHVHHLRLFGYRNAVDYGISSNAPTQDLVIDNVEVKGFGNGVYPQIGNDDKTDCTGYEDIGTTTRIDCSEAHGYSSGDVVLISMSGNWLLFGKTHTVTTGGDADSFVILTDATSTDAGPLTGFTAQLCGGTGSTCRNSGWEITNSELHDNERQGIGGDYTDVLIDGNRVFNNGGNDIDTQDYKDHCLYIGGNDLVVTNNVFGPGCAANLWGTGHASNEVGVCGGAMVNFNGSGGYGVMSNMTITDNIVIGGFGTGVSGACWGISVDTGSSSPENYQNITIARNYILNAGSRAISMGNVDVGGLIENNVIAFAGAALADSMYGIAVAAKSMDADDIPAKDVVVRNNTIFADTNQTSDLRCGAINTAGGTEGEDGWEFYNNLCLNEGSGDTILLNAGGAESDFTTVDYNAADDPNTGGLTWINGTAPVSDHVTRQNCEDDPDHAWCINGQEVALALEDTTAPDIGAMAASGSANQVDTGSSSGPTTDFLGKTRTASKDIGAYEWIATTDAYWIGGSGDWSAAANWSTSSGGGAAGGVPDADSIAIVDDLSGSGTITLDVDALVRDLDITSVSTMTALAFGAQELRCERDCTINDAIAITATSGTGILSAGRNLDTVGVDFSGVDNLSINLYGPGFWEYNPDGTAPGDTNIDIDDLTVAQDGWTTVLKQNGPATVGSSDINIHGQWFLGPGYLDYDLSLETGNDDVPIIEFQNGNEDFSMMFYWGTIPDMEVEWEQTTGDRSVISHRAIYDGTTLDIKGASAGTPGTGHHFWFSGDIDLLGGTFWFNKLASLYQRGHDLTAGNARISFNQNSNDWYLEGGAVTITDEFQVSDSGGRSILDLGVGGTFTAGYLLVETEPLWLTGGEGSAFVVTDATPGTCSTHKYVDPDAAGGGDGDIGTPWNDWTNVEANLTAATDCVYFDKATTLALGASDELVGAGTGGILGAYGTGADPVITLAADGQLDIDNGVAVYAFRVEFGGAVPPSSTPTIQGGGISSGGYSAQVEMDIMLDLARVSLWASERID